MNEPSKIQLPFFTLLLLISFASVNAVLFTPALPEISQFFAISSDTAELTISWFLVGYALGQLVYGPLTNRFGRKPTLYAGVGLQIISSLLCILAGIFHTYLLLVISRFLMALGSGVGLKMTFTLVNENYTPKVASQKISYLMLAFAVTPSLSIALGGLLTMHFNWMSCFYAGIIYGFILIIAIARLPAMKNVLDYEAFKIKNLLHHYGAQFKNTQLVAGGLLMGGCTTFVYVFATLAPFIAINYLGMNSAEYGFANIFPSIGLVIGSLCSAKLAMDYPLKSTIRVGLIISSMGTGFMMISTALHYGAMFSLFLPMTIIYFGLSLTLANTSSIAMSLVLDKAHGSAVMSFINMGFTTIIVLSLKFFPIHAVLLPSIYIVMCIVMASIFRVLTRTQ